MALSRRCCVRAIACVAVFLGGSTVALAQTNGTWTSTSGGTWGDSANWSLSNIASGTGAVADFSTLNITGVQTVTLDAPRTSGTLLFGDTGSPAGGWTLTGSTLTLATVSGAPTISVTGFGSSHNFGTAAATIQSVIDGTSGFTKSGTSALVLSAANTYSGTTTVSAGYLVVNDASALGNSSTVNATGNSGLVIGSGLTIGAGTTFTVNSGGAGSGDGGLTVLSGGTGTWAGAVTMGSGGRLGYRDSNLVVSGSIGGSNGLLISGYGGDTQTSGVSQYAVTVSGTTNAYTGSTQIIRGFLKIGADNALPTTTSLNIHSINASANSATFDLNGFNQTVGEVSSSGIINSSGDVVGFASGFLTNTGTAIRTFTVNQATSGTFAAIITGNLAFTKGGAGNLTLRPVLVVSTSNGVSGTNTFAGDTLVNAGTLTLGGTNALFGSTFDTSGAGTLSFGSLSGATFGGLKNSGTVSLQNNASNAVTLSVGGTNVSSTFAGRLTGTGGLTKVGSGTFTLTGATNDYGGTTTVSAGTLLLSNSAAIPGIVTSGRYSVAAGATLATGTSFDDATLQAMVGTGNFAATSILGVDTGAGNRTFSSPLTGTVGLAITGTNRLTLSATNALGAVSVTGATLTLTNASALAGSGAITVNGGTVEWSPPGQTNYSFNGRSIVVTGSGGTFRGTTDNLQLQFGNISGTGAVVFASGASTIVTNANTYSGGTTIKPGAFIAVTAGNGFGSGPVTIEGGSLRSSNGTPQTVANTVSLAGNVTFNASGSAVDNNLTFTGPMTITGATRTVDVSMSPRTGATGIFFNGPIGDGGNTLGLVKTGTSMLILGGTNTYTGTTTLANGTLRLDNASALGGGGNLSFTGGTLQYSGSNQADYSARIVNSGSAITIDTNGQSVSFGSALAASNTGGLTKSGSGTLTLGANNAFTGVTTVSGGTLQIGTGGATGAIGGNLTLSSSAAVVFNRSDAVVFGNVVTGGGTFTKAGAGTLTLSGSANAMTGAIAILGGALVTTNAASLTTEAGTSFAFTIDSGTLMSAANAPANGFSARFASLSIGPGGATIRSDQRIDNLNVISGTSPTASLTYGTTTGTASGVTMVISGNNTYAGGTRLESGVDMVVDNNNAFGTGTLDLAGARIRSRSGPPRSLANAVTISATTVFFGASSEPNLTFTGAALLSGATRTLDVVNVITGGTSAGQPGVIFTNVIGDGGNGFGITKTGAGVLALGGANTYSGTTTVAAGTLRLDAAGALGGGGNLSFTGGTLQYTASNTADYGGRIRSSSAPIRIDTNSQSITWSGTVDASNVGGLAKSGAGTLVLVADNTYTGTTAVSGGTLQLGNGGASGGIAGNVALSNSAAFVVNRADSVTYAGVVSGVGSVTKQGPGTLTLTGAQTFAGSTTVTGGTLAFTTEGVWTAVAGSIVLDGGALAYTGTTAGVQSVGQPIQLGAGGGTLANPGSAIWSVNGLISGTGPLTLASGATSMVLTNANTNSGGVTLAAGSQVVVAIDSVGPAGTPTSGVFGTGTLTLAGGGLRATTGAARTVGNAILAAADTTFLSAGSNTDKSLLLTGPTTLSGGNRTFTVNTTGTGEPAIVFSGAIGDGGNALGLTKAGPGSMILAGVNTYTGPTVVSAGSLLVNGTQAGGSLTVDLGAVLGGSGLIGGAVTVSGTLSPGNSPGVLTMESLVLGGTSTSIFEIDGTARGTAYDGVDITGGSGPTYGGTLSLEFGNLAAFDNGTTFDLFDFGVLLTSGSFTSVSSSGFYAGTWTNNNDGSFKLDSGSQTLTFTQATGDLVIVPEPAALALAGIGAGLAAWRIVRRRRRIP